jgi:hypothetical protein
MTTVLNGRNNQQERGLSVNQDKIRPKLTSEQRKTMTDDEKKEYHAGRLKEYRNEYKILYAKEVVSKQIADARKEKEYALIFYRQHKQQLEALAVIPPLVSLELV